jgi:predicted RNA-binding Zn-ribbon protein involved in translation (DUF1610 family)
MHHLGCFVHQITVRAGIWLVAAGPPEEEVIIMSLHSKEAVGVRYTGRAALNRDPQEDNVEYNCPYCGKPGMKAARRTHDQYHFTDGFLQDLQGEMAACRSCRHSLRIAPVVMLHDQDEKRRFQAVFADVLVASNN